MPFNPLYKSSFSAGDLIYGLATARPRLVIKLGVDILNAKGPSTVDQYRKSTMEAMSKHDRKDWKTFLSDNEKHSKYGVYMQLIRSHNNNEESFAGAGVSEAAQNAAWRAKSKFGMEWTIKNQRGHIHFVLDDIDMGAVVTKTHRFAANGVVLAQDSPRGKAGPGVSKERTITHSELRWIYRNRANPIVQNRVQFWLTRNGTISPCEPPWLNATSHTRMPSGKLLSWAHSWQAYKPTAEKGKFD